MKRNFHVEEFLDYCYEGYLFNEKDFFYNKERWDNGEINICFVTGHSGSGKSTLAKKMVTTEDNTEHYELDDVLSNKEHFTMQEFKVYGNLIYSFFKGPGKKYYYTSEDVKQGLCESVGDNYEINLFNDFIDYSISYAKSHKERKYVIEGIWLFLFINPEKLKDCAVCIKGTSAWISNWRAAKRDSGFEKDGDRLKTWINRFMLFFKGGVGTIDSGIRTEKRIREWKRYFIQRA